MTRATAWATAPAVTVLCLFLNYLYHEFLRNYIGLPVDEGHFTAHKDLFLWAVLAICVQPALVEELFFRYLALNSLRTVTGTHGAVLISSVMFGMAHIGNPLGIPYLILVGMVLGYSRIASGTLLLPMLMHFTHNLAVLLIW
jgi:membrane protease YdiL (CAAX protease family)